MPEMNVDGEIDLDFLRSCLVEAGQMALGQRGQRIASIKADHTPVTEVDHQVEHFLIRRIRARYPDHQILSEESGLHPSDETFTWVIDPIDGTRAFASGLPVWGVSIGIMHQSEPVAGGLYLPVTGETYWGTRQQAFYNGQPVSPVETVDLDSPLGFLGVPSSFHLYFEISYPRIRSMGSTAAQLAYVATGAAVGTLTYATSLWDLAGILPMLTATGIHVKTLGGQPFRPAEFMDGQKIREPILAAHPSVFQVLQASIVGKESRK
jgi:myo-inositol-1(or 4)-monophosphatase